MGIDLKGNVIEIDAIDFGRGVTMRLRPGTTDIEVLNGTFNAGDLAGVHQVGAGETLVINELGVDADFRIEGDTDINLLFIDASTDRVGIGTATPAALLDVDGISRASQLESDIATGTAPFIVASTTTVANLDAATAALAADSTLLGGLAATAYALLAGRAGGQILIGGTGASDNLTLRASSNADEGFVLVDNQEDGVSLEVLRLQSARATPANLDIISQNFYQPNSASAQFQFGRIESVISFVTSGTEGGRLGFICPVRLNAGAQTEIFRADGAGSIPGFVFNATDSTFIDFHVRGGAEAFLINADTGLDTVGIGGAAIANVQLLVEHDTNQVSSELLRLQSTRSVRANNDEVFLSFYNPDSGGAQDETARITGSVENVTAASERGRLLFLVQQHGSLIEMCRMQAEGATSESVVFNEFASDQDFRIEGTDEINLFVVDAALGLVAIGGGVQANVQLKIERDTDEVATEILRLQSTRATRADNDEIYLSFFQPNSAGTQIETHRLISIFTDVTAGTEDTRFRIQANRNGSLADMLNLGRLADGTSRFGILGTEATIQSTTQDFSTADSTHATRTAAALTDNTTGAAPDGTIADLTAFAASVAWDGAAVFPSAADETAIALIVTQTRDAIGELADQINKLRVDQVDTAAFINFVTTALVNHGILEDTGG